MYAAFWINPKAEESNKRVVVCRPFVKKPSVAWAILKSAIHDECTGGIIAGPLEDLQNCIKAIDETDEKWPDNGERIVGLITTVARRTRCQVIFRQNLAPSTETKTLQKKSTSGHVFFGEPQASVDGYEFSVVEASENALEQLSYELEVEHGFTQSTSGLSKKTDHGTYAFISDPVSQQRATWRFEASIEEPRSVTAAGLPPTPERRSEEGETFAIDRRHFDLVEDILSKALDSTKCRFVLIIKPSSGDSIVFFGFKPARTPTQAVDVYVEHLREQPPPKPKKRKSDDDDEEVVVEPPEPARPQLRQVRFFRVS